MKMTTDNIILRRIEQMQCGKQGIYPYRVAQDIAAEFTVPLSFAIDCVVAHIRAELAKADK